MDDFDLLFEMLESKAKLEREINTAQEWVNSSFYNTTWSRDLYPYWKEKLIEFDEGDYNELVITGGLGSGKSIFGFQVLARYLYKLSCYDKPPKACGLSEATRIFVGYLSVSLKQALMSGFTDLIDMVSSNEYFNRHSPMDQNINSYISMPDKRLMIVPGSKAAHVIGTNLLVCIMDESNFYGNNTTATSTDINKATQIYTDVTDRRRSRFAGEDALYKGFSVLISSATATTSFTEDRIAKADKHTMVVNAPTWISKPGRYTKPTFFCFCGNNKVEAQVVDSPQQITEMFGEDIRPVVNEVVSKNPFGTSNEHIDAVVEVLPANLKYRFTQPPGEFLKSFRENPSIASANIAGISQVSQGKLFTDVNSWNDCIVDDIKSPFSAEHVTVSVKTRPVLEDFLRDPLIYSGSMLRHPEQPRFIHIDQSKVGDPTGIAMCIEGNQRVVTDRGLLRIRDFEGNVFDTETYSPGKLLPKGVQRVVEVMSKGGVSLKCTPDHRILCLTGESRVHPSWVKASELKVNDRILTRIGGCAVTEMVKFEDYIINEDMAWVLGFLLGDGNISDKNGIRVRFICLTEEETSEVSDRMYRVFGLRPNIEVRDLKEGTINVLCYNRKWLVEYLKRMGLKVSWDKIVPECIFRSPRSVIVSFINGWLEADGSVSRDRGDISGCSVDVKFIHDLCVLCRYVGIPARITYGKRGRNYLRIVRTGDFKFVIKHKQERLLANPGVAKFARYHNKGAILDPDVIIERVKEVKELGETQVFDIGLESSPHRFLASSFTVHNCHLHSFRQSQGGIVLPVIEYDLLMEMPPPKKPDEIAIAKIRIFFYNLYRKGMTIGHISYDQYASDEALQFFMAKEIPCSRQSVDGPKKDVVWIQANTAVKSNRVRMFAYPPLRKSYFGLDHDRVKGKVDHPPGVHKDVSDAFVASMNSCLVFHSVTGDVSKDAESLIDAYEEDTDLGICTLEGSLNRLVHGEMF